MYADCMENVKIDCQVAVQASIAKQPFVIANEVKQYPPALTKDG